MTRTPYPRDGTVLSLCRSGDGVPFVFQHGLCGDAHQPADVMPDGCGFACVTLECRGHGESGAGPLEALSIATFADDVASAIERLEAGPVVLGGISMGAALALRLAVTRPDLVRGLVLARPAWVTGPAPPNMRPNALAGELLATWPAALARARFEASDEAAALAVSAPDNLASIRGFFSRVPQDVTAALLTRISADGPGVSEADVAALAVPTLVIGHGRDTVHPIANARHLAQTIRLARLVEITPKADDPQRYRSDFRAALAAFLTELRP